MPGAHDFRVGEQRTLLHFFARFCALLCTPLHYCCHFSCEVDFFSRFFCGLPVRCRPPSGLSRRPALLGLSTTYRFCYLKRAKCRELTIFVSIFIRGGFFSHFLAIFAPFAICVIRGRFFFAPFTISLAFFVCKIAGGAAPPRTPLRAPSTYTKNGDFVL